MTEEKNEQKKYGFMEYASQIVDGSPDKAAARALIAIAEELRKLNKNSIVLLIRKDMDEIGLTISPTTSRPEPSDAGDVLDPPF